MTIDNVVVNLGYKEQSPGLSFVALSRVRCLEDMLISYE